MATSYPTVDESFVGLDRAGWSAGYARFCRKWAIYGVNGENVIDGAGATPEEAYWRAGLQAREVGTLESPRSEEQPRATDDGHAAPHPLWRTLAHRRLRPRHLQ
jgi:hypothetical protein